MTLRRAVGYGAVGAACVFISGAAAASAAAASTLSEARAPGQAGPEGLPWLPDAWEVDAIVDTSDDGDTVQACVICGPGTS